MNNPKEKNNIIKNFGAHVSSGKAIFFEKYGMEFMMGDREGAVFKDIEGKKQLFNLHCNGGVFNLGHRNSEIMDVVMYSLEDLDIGNHHLMSKERTELATMLADLMPGDLNYTIFGVSGGEATDLSIKIARGYTGKTKIISAMGGYHGHTGLALATGDKQYRQPFGPNPPGFEQVIFGDIQALKDSIDTNTAAVILETIPATLGIIIPDKAYLQGVRELCNQTNTLLILDEVQAGLGRTGKLWAFQHYDIIPDMVILGKGLSGGIYPISATVIRSPLEKVFHPYPFIHISTFGGAEIGCRVARKVLEISSSQRFLDHVNKLSAIFKNELGTLKQNHSKFFLEARQLGLMMGLKLKDEVSGPLLTKAAYDHDLLLIYANNDQSVCQLLPPLNMKAEDIPFVFKKLHQAMISAQRLGMLIRGKNYIKSIIKK